MCDRLQNSIAFCHSFRRWKIKFCSRALRLSELPGCRERPQTATCYLKWLGRLKCPATGSDASLSFPFTSRRCSRNRSPSRLHVSPWVPTLWMKGQVLHRERAHLKVPGWSLVWNELLTKKLPMFLSRLNEISGGCEKIVPVSESFWSNLKFLRMIDLTAWLWGWNVRVNGMRSVFSFSAVCSADCRSICWARWWPA